MIKIDEELLKKLMAIVTAYADHYFYIKRDVIEQLINDNGFDDDALFFFLRDVDELRDEILEGE